MYFFAHLRNLLQVNPELEQQVQEAMLQKIDQKLAESEQAAGGTGAAVNGSPPPSTPPPVSQPDRSSSLASAPSGVSDMEKKGLLDAATPQSQPSSTPGGPSTSAAAGDPEAGDVAVTMMPRCGGVCECLCHAG